MKIAIVGFAGSGKSSVFKALIGSKEINPSKTNIGKVSVKDDRLDKLTLIFKPNKITPEELIFMDLHGFNLAQIKDIETVMHVIGVFSGRDYKKDIENMELEFMVSDLAIIEKRLPRLEKELTSKATVEKENEKKILIKCKKFLELNKPLRSLELNHDEKNLISGYQFLSLKPIFILANLEENQLNSNITNEIEQYANKIDLKNVTFCAKIESEIQDLKEEDKEEFIRGLGLEASALEKVIKTARATLGLITFYTVKGKETRAWAVPDGTKAIDAAGKIHTDIKKGFIKAEVINYNDFIEGGSFAEVKKKGLLRLEGREYIVKDGDIIDFKFNV